MSCFPDENFREAYESAERNMKVWRELAYKLREENEALREKEKKDIEHKCPNPECPECRSHVSTEPVAVWKDLKDIPGPKPAETTCPECSPELRREDVLVRAKRVLEAPFARDLSGLRPGEVLEAVPGKTEKDFEAWAKEKVEKILLGKDPKATVPPTLLNVHEVGPVAESLPAPTAQVFYLDSKAEQELKHVQDLLRAWVKSKGAGSAWMDPTLKAIYDYGMALDTPAAPRFTNTVRLRPSAVAPEDVEKAARVASGEEPHYSDITPEVPAAGELSMAGELEISFVPRKPVEHVEVTAEILPPPSDPTPREEAPKVEAEAFEAPVTAKLCPRCKWVPCVCGPPAWVRST